MTDVQIVQSAAKEAGTFLVLEEAETIVAALFAAGRLVTPETTQWGAQHAQGVRWESNEAAARSAVREFVARDSRIQRPYQGRVRLVRRYLGDIEVVENPYEQGSAS